MPLILQAKFRTIIDVPARTDKKTGEIRAAYTQVQIEDAAATGRLQLYTLSVKDRKAFEGKKDGDTVVVKVRPYATGPVSLAMAEE